MVLNRKGDKGKFFVRNKPKRGYEENIHTKKMRDAPEGRDYGYFTIFEGEYREEMQKLRARKLFPATVELVTILQFRNYPDKGDASLHDKFATSSGIASAPDNGGKFKIIPYCELLGKVDGLTFNYNGGLKSIDYESIKEEEFTSADMILNKPLTENQALAHVGLKYIVRGDEKLLEQVVGFIFEETYNKYGKKEAAGLYIRIGNGIANVRPVSIRSLSAGYGITDFEGLGIMEKTRLIGLRRNDFLEEYLHEVLATEEKGDISHHYRQR